MSERNHDRLSGPRAIETLYAGCRFRSRLEARWAVFLDQLGFAWEYEPEGYVLSDGACYLPDFRLAGSHRGPHFEVKGSDEQLQADEDRIASFAAESGCSAVVVLGEIPRVVPGGALPLHPAYTPRTRDRRGPSSAVFGSRPHVMLIESVHPHASVKTTHPPRGLPLALEADVERAYVAARSARFEHGESGAAAEVPATPPSTPVRDPHLDGIAGHLHPTLGGSSPCRGSG